MKKTISILVTALIFAVVATAQIPTATHIQILKAEDARRYDKTLEDLMRSSNAEVRERAALAAGRIGAETAVIPLLNLLEKDSSIQVRVMATFALGEIESIKAADGIISLIRGGKEPSVELTMTRTKNGKEMWTDTNPMARLVEAAGKIAAANPTNKKADELREALLNYLETQVTPSFGAENRHAIQLTLTALLRAASRDAKRARPDRTDTVVAKFLTHAYLPLRADALNTLARLRAKNANSEARELLKNHADPIVRANAARVLGAAEDKDALDILLIAATTDTDSRVRVSAIRALGNLKDAKAADKLLVRGEKLLIDYQKSKRTNAVEKNELLDIATTIGRLLPQSEDQQAIKFLANFRKADRYRSAETEVALATVAPKFYFEYEIESLTAIRTADPGAASAIFQGYGRIAILEKKEEYKKIIQETRYRLLKFAEGWFWDEDTNRYAKKKDRPVPDMLRAFAADKSGGASGILQPMLDREKDVYIRATLAELLANEPKTKENIETLIVAFARALESDKYENDAQFAILDALYKLDKKEAVGSLLRALNAPDYLLRKKAIGMLEDKNLQKEFPEIVTALNLARGNNMDEVLPHKAEMMEVVSKSGTKLGQVLNTDADYRRAGQRKNGSVKAVLTTEKGKFTIEFYPEEAPLTVDNFIKLARSGYFNGLEVHRVVPNFVMQDGDPRGDGNGGPGWSIRCEVNMLPYDRGAVGMALSGKDTGGSQWFVTHSPQPHLDGGYTVFGHVNETDMKVVDKIVRGDKIVTVKIIGR